MTDDLRARFAALPGAERVLAALRPEEEVYAVGGTVRDLLAGRAPLDIDLAVAAGDPTEIARRLGRSPTLHDRFRTASVRDEHRRRYDLAATRRERYPAPGALPEVEPAGIEEDLARRDFAVNALALGLSGPLADELLAAPRAEADLAAGRLRVLHDASFRDDPTRLLRLVRYAARLGFAVEAGTSALAREAVAGGALTTVSGPRIGAEVELLADEADAVSGFVALRARGLDAQIAAGFGLDDPEAVRQGLALLAEGGPQGDWRGHLVLGAALLGVAEAERRGLLERLGISSYMARVALEVAREAPRIAAQLPVVGPPSAVLAVMAGAEPEAVALAGGLGGPDAAADASRWRLHLSRARLEIDGFDVIAAGVPRGPAVGVALRAALAAKLDGVATTRDAQLAVALRAGSER